MFSNTSRTKSMSDEKRRRTVSISHTPNVQSVMQMVVRSAETNRGGISSKLPILQILPLVPIPLAVILRDLESISIFAMSPSSTSIKALEK